MSAAAEQYVQACTHPQVKGGALALLEAIARHIPEGQTATPAIAIEDLATMTRQHRSTVWRGLDVLIEIGVINVLDGGRGRIARYELVHLDGARPITTAPLPLVGAAPRRARAKVETSNTPSLFDQPAEGGTLRERTVENVVQFALRVVRNVWQFALRWGRSIPNVSQIALRWRSTYSKLPHVAPAHLDLDLRRSTSEEAERARAPDVQRFLDWWLAVFPTLRGGAHYTLRSGDAAKAAKLLEGRTLERVQAMSTAAMTMRADGRRSSNWIATADDFSISVVLWKATFLDEEVGRLSVGPTQAPTEDIWAQILQRVESQVKRHEFLTWFAASTLVRDDGARITVATDYGEYLERNHGDVLRAAVQAERPGATVTFVAADAQQRKSS